MNLSSILPWIQILLSILLVGAILLQQSGAGRGGTFGGSSQTNPFKTKRGVEKQLFIATIILAVLFITSVLLTSYLKI